MSTYWSSGLPPYIADTHIVDGRTQLNHQSIMDGVARDVGWLQHNINTTHLFASGFLHPIVSGYFRNIDTNYLYVNNINTRVLTLNNVVQPYVSSFSMTGDSLIVSDSAFRNNNLSVSDTFKGPNSFSLTTTSGFIYNPATISGGLYNYYLQRTGDYKLLGGLFSSLTMNSGNINIDSNHRVFVSLFGSFSPSGTISESGIFWQSSMGHNHKEVKITASNITDNTVVYYDDLNLDSLDGSIDISGVLDADHYIQETYYDSIGFYELDYTGNGTYTCDIPSYSGYVKDLDIGMSPIISYSGQIYATSKTAPSGSKNLSDAYIYISDDLYSWHGYLVSGTFRAANTSGVATVDACVINNNTLYFLWNYKVSSGNYCHFGTLSNMQSATSPKYSLGKFAHDSSRYGVGLSSIENNLMIYGYEYPHLYTSGIPKWDRHCLKDDGKDFITNSTGQDLSYSGVIYQYSYPFIQGYSPAAPNQSMYWLDGSIYRDGYQQEPSLITDTNGDAFNMLSHPDDNFSGYFASFFGNGFSEITSLLSIDGAYHNGQRGIFTHRKATDEYVYHSDVVENYSTSPVLIFGNSTLNTTTTKGSGIFGGCVPIVLDIDKRLWDMIGLNTINVTSINNNNLNFAPMFLHGSRSLLDTGTLFRIPSYLYYPGGHEGIMTSNLYSEWIGNSGRLWTDYSWRNGQRTELINMCPWQPGLLTFPFGGSGQVYYKHDSSDITKVTYTSMYSDSNGLIIPSGTFTDHRNYPTYYDRPIKTGFWSSKTFDWWYMPAVDHSSNTLYFAASGNAPEPPSGSYPKTYYYQRPKCPLQHNGVIYNILEFNTGYICTGPNGSEYIDDNIMYSDLIKYGNTIYGVGVIIDSSTEIPTDHLILVTIKRNVSTKINLTTTLSGKQRTPKFLIHKGMLYVGLGGGRFLVKKPSHTDLCITTNL